MKLSEFSKRSSCNKHRSMEKFQFKGRSNRSLDEAVITKDIIKAVLSDTFSYGSVKELQQVIADSAVTVDTVDEYQESKERNLAMQINRYLQWETRDAIIPEGPINVDISEFLPDIDPEDAIVPVRMDAIFIEGCRIEGVVYKNGAPKLTSTSRGKASVKTDIPLHLMTLALEQYATENGVFAGVNDDDPPRITASYYYMRRPDDTSSAFMPIYESLRESASSSPIRSVYYHDSNLAAVKTSHKAHIKELFEKWQLGCSGSEIDEDKDCKGCDKWAVCHYQPIPEKVDDESSPKARKPIEPTDEQKAVINAREGVFIVNAGAGSGKTETAIKERTTSIVLGELDELVARYEAGDDVEITSAASYLTKDSRK